MNLKGKNMWALLALKTVCCVGLLLALGAFSIGSFLAFFGNGWVQAGGVVIAAAGLARYLWIQRRRQARQTQEGKQI